MPWPCWPSSGGGWRSVSPTSRSPSTRPSWCTAAGCVDTVTLVLDEVRTAFDDLLEGRAYRPEVRILPALLGERAGAIGAALVARAGDRYRVDVA